MIQATWISLQTIKQKRRRQQACCNIVVLSESLENKNFHFTSTESRPLILRPKIPQVECNTSHHTPHV